MHVHNVHAYCILEGRSMVLVRIDYGEWLVESYSVHDNNLLQIERTAS